MDKRSGPQPRIPAAKQRLGDEALYHLFGLPSLRRMFANIWLQFDGPLPQRGPLLFYLNHSSWWDGYMMMLVHRRVFGSRFDSYLMMEEKQLRAFRFFTWCGAFSIDRRDPDDVANALGYAVGLLRQPNRALFIFPQGRISHNDRRPIVTFPGAARIALALEAVTLCPITFRYELLGQQQAHAFIRIGPTHRPDLNSDREALNHELAERLRASADALREQVVAGDFARFARILRGRRGIDEQFGGLLRRLGLVRERPWGNETRRN